MAKSLAMLQRVRALLTPEAGQQVRLEDVILPCDGCASPLQYRGRVDGLEVLECPSCQLPYVVAGLPMNRAAMQAEQEKAENKLVAAMEAAQVCAGKRVPAETKPAGKTKHRKGEA